MLLKVRKEYLLAINGFMCLSLKEVDSQTARSNVYLSNRTEESVL